MEFSLKAFRRLGEAPEQNKKANHNDQIESIEHNSPHPMVERHDIKIYLQTLRACSSGTRTKHGSASELSLSSAATWFVAESTKTT